MKDYLRDTLEFAVITTIIVLTAVSGQTIMHETAHAEIYDAYGCDNISIEYGPELREEGLVLGETTASCDISDRNELKAQHQIVHTVQYLTLIPLLLLCVSVALRLAE